MQAGLHPLGNPIQHVLGPTRVLVLTSEPLEYPRSDLPAHVRFVGAQLWDPPAEAPAWLDEPGEPWVRVLVTATAELPAAPTVRVERFVAHGPVLERAAAVVCHGGMGIVQKAIAAGVPIVAVPFGRDQPEVARRITGSGAGVAVPLKRLSAGRLRVAVRDAMAIRPAARTAGGPESFAAAVEQGLVLEAHGVRSFAW